MRRAEGDGVGGVAVGRAALQAAGMRAARLQGWLQSCLQAGSAGCKLLLQAGACHECCKLLQAERGQEGVGMQRNAPISDIALLYCEGSKWVLAVFGRQL